MPKASSFAGKFIFILEDLSYFPTNFERATFISTFINGGDIV